MKKVINKVLWVIYAVMAAFFLFTAYRLAESMGSQTYFLPGFVAGVVAFAGLNLFLIMGDKGIRRLIRKRKYKGFRRVTIDMMTRALNRCADCHALREEAGGKACDIYHTYITSIQRCGEYEGDRGDINSPEWL